ncbi:hypothetical protein BGM26_20600 [Bacillus sp. FJAT-29790]|nr:hypothetical protein [Bacillus sp. FJAT-29790]MBU8881322.1 hypothetical protein [Bacillus sp. FJAT-29790]
MLRGELEDHDFNRILVEYVSMKEGFDVAEQLHKLVKGSSALSCIVFKF